MKYIATLMTTLMSLSAMAQVSGYVDPGANKFLHNIGAAVADKVKQQDMSSRATGLKRYFIQNGQVDNLRKLFKIYPQAVNDPNDDVYFLIYSKSYKQEAHRDWYKEPIACMAANLKDSSLLKVYIENNVKNFEHCYSHASGSPSLKKMREYMREDYLDGDVFFIDWNNDMPHASTRPYGERKHESTLLHVIMSREDAVELLEYMVDKNATHLIASMTSWDLMDYGKSSRFMALVEKRPELLLSNSNWVWQSMSAENRQAALDAFPQLFEKLDWDFVTQNVHNQKERDVFDRFARYHLDHDSFPKSGGVSLNGVLMAYWDLRDDKLITPFKPSFVSQEFWVRCAHAYRDTEYAVTDPKAPFLAEAFKTMLTNNLKYRSQNPTFIGAVMDGFKKSYEQKKSQISDERLLAQLTNDYNYLMSICKNHRDNIQLESDVSYFERPSDWDWLKKKQPFLAWFNEKKGDPGFKVTGYRIEKEEDKRLLDGVLYGEPFFPDKTYLIVSYAENGEEGYTKRLRL